MKNTKNAPIRFKAAFIAGLTLIVLVALFLNRPTTSDAPVPPSTSIRASTAAASPLDPCQWIKVPHEGQTALDQHIQKLQTRLDSDPNPAVVLEQLGWAFVTKGRDSSDPGFYTLAGQCAACLQTANPDAPEAKLLQGHVLQNLHQFKEAEQLARSLVDERGLPFDFGLLGDCLMEQGQLAAATEAYQEMINLKPGLHSYARAAHMRWLTGDTDGAVEAMNLAVQSGSPNAPTDTAWATTRLAFYELENGSATLALETCTAALQIKTNFAPALLLKGRILLALDRHEEAIPWLQTAQELNPLPEYLWTFSEALRQSGQTAAALEVEQTLTRTAAASDPRTSALFLATRGSSPAEAVRLAEEELEQRADIFTHDALAWALAQANRLEEAQHHMDEALKEGTRNGRLFFHAASIASRRNLPDKAQYWFAQAIALSESLLPSEHQQLLQVQLTASADSPRALQAAFSPTVLKQ